jgi:tetratricopeptide (TPR) repeat protein
MGEEKNHGWNRRENGIHQLSPDEPAMGAGDQLRTEGAWLRCLHRFQQHRQRRLRDHILENLCSRAHFLILLTPSALDRCSEPGDWLRREIETALEEKRNIVPILLDDFHFKSPSIAGKLTGRLAELPGYNALSMSLDFLDEGIDKLCKQFLNITLDAVPRPISSSARQAAKEQQDAADAAPPVQKEQLSAQTYYERAFAATDPKEKLRFYTRCLELQPRNADAYYNRALIRHEQHDLQGAIEDYTQAMRLNPEDPDPWHGRGNARYDRGDLSGAIDDYTRAIRIKPDSAVLYVSRAFARYDNGDTKGAMDDYAKAIEANPKYAEAYNGRGYTLYNEGDTDAAIADYTKAIELKPDYAQAYSNRAYLRSQKNDFKNAVDDYTRVIEIQPTVAKPYYDRGYVFWQQGQYQQAINDFQKYIGLGGDDSPRVEQYIRDMKPKLSTSNAELTS